MIHASPAACQVIGPATVPSLSAPAPTLTTERSQDLSRPYPPLATDPSPGKHHPSKERCPTKPESPPPSLSSLQTRTTPHQSAPSHNRVGICTKFDDVLKVHGPFRPSGSSPLQCDNLPVKGLRRAQVQRRERDKMLGLSLFYCTQPKMDNISW